MMTLTIKTESAQEALNIALIFVRQSQQKLEAIQARYRADKNLFMDSRLEDAIAALETAMDQLVCSRCPHAATSVRDDGPMCDLCAADFVECPACGKDVRLAEAFEDERGRQIHVECETLQSSTIFDRDSGQ